MTYDYVHCFANIYSTDSPRIPLGSISMSSSFFPLKSDSVPFSMAIRALLIFASCSVSSVDSDIVTKEISQLVCFILAKVKNFRHGCYVFPEPSNDSASGFFMPHSQGALLMHSPPLFWQGTLPLQLDPFLNKLYVVLFSSCLIMASTNQNRLT